MASDPFKKMSVEEILLSLPRAEQVIAKKLRAVILECLPKAVEKNSYGVPFYSRHRMICFIWPPSIRWGPKKEQNDKATKGVVLGFCYGNLMSHDDGVLKAEGRKQVYCTYYTSLSEINEAQIQAWLFEADLIDESFGKRKKIKSR